MSRMAKMRVANPGHLGSTLANLEQHALRNLQFRRPEEEDL